MRFVERGSARIAYAVGGGTGPPVLLIHAGVTDQRSWAPLIDALGSRYRWITYDQRGYGETTFEPEDHSAVADAVAVLDAAGAESAIVIGASNGGRRAIQVALDHPDRVEALVLIGAAAGGGPDDDITSFPAEVQALYAAVEAAEEAGDLDELNRVEAHVWLDGWAAPEGRVQGAVRDLFLDMNGIALRAADPGDDGTGPVWDSVGQIAVPTLVLIGDLDVVEAPASAHFAATIPDVRYEVLENTGHLPHLEGHPRALQVIEEFLASIDVAMWKGSPETP